MSWVVQIVLSALLGIAIAIAASFGSSQVVMAPTEHVPVRIESATTTVATSTPLAIPLAAATSSPASTPAKKPTQKAPQPAAPTSIHGAVNAAAPTAAATPASSPDAVTEMVRAAVVNIICTTQESGSVDSISGSGIFIDSRGIIMTNSHIAQFFLLNDYPAPGSGGCVIRSGSPAASRYTADLLFMPPSWMAENASKIRETDPTGDGEHDYAFLVVTGTANPQMPPPSSFPALAISTVPPVENQSVLLAAYPAGFLGGMTIANNFYETSSDAVVGTLYSFVAQTLDLFSVGGTVVAQKGSSGGAVTDQNGTLLGLIVTATEAPDTASRDLRALSTPYIISDFQKESGVSLAAFLGGDISSEKQQFSTGIEPTLRAELVSALTQQ